MQRMIIKISKTIFVITLFVLMLSFNAFAEKYTIASGKDFNARIKMYLNENNSSATPEYTIKAFKYSSSLDGAPIDISEDGDSSVLAYIKDNIIYYLSDDDIYLNYDSSYMFDKFINLKQIDLTHISFKKVRKMNYMFGNCKYLTDLDMDNDETIILDEMQGMFFDCQSIVDLNIFMINTKNVRNMNSMFFNCKNLKNIFIDTSKWSINKVNNFSKMYNNCAMLRTNFNIKAIDIDENKYKQYSIAGDEDKEGLLKDFDYEYDDYGKKSGSFPVDKISETLIVSQDNKNSIDNISQKDLQMSKVLSVASISTNSELYLNNSNTRIGKDGKVKLSDWIIGQTVDEIPILKEETTFVDKLIPKKKNNTTKSDSSRIVEEEDGESQEVNGILRPDYTSFSDEFNNNDSLNDVNLKIDKPIFLSDMSIAIILVSVVIIITIGVFVFYFKNKHNSDESWS